MEKFIREIQAKNVFGRLNFSLKFSSTINVIHAENGAGKTTLLHILANALNGHYTRFAYLSFSSIIIKFSNGDTLRISRDNPSYDSLILVELNKKLIWEGVTTSIRRQRTKSEIGQLSLFEEGELEILSGETEKLSTSTEPLLQASYFPAFRTMIEAWTNGAQEDLYRRGGISSELADLEVVLRKQGAPVKEARFQAISTQEARKAFGQFVPVVNYPSPSEIARILDEETKRAFLDIGNKDRELLSKVFIDVLKALSESSSAKSSEEDAEKILGEIQKILSDDERKGAFQKTLPLPLALTTGVFGQLRESVHSVRLGTNARNLATPILDVYRNSLIDRANAQERAFSQIELYLNSVNAFLQGKSIVIHSTSRGEIFVGIRFDDGMTVNGLTALSSGERQIVTLIYAATRMSSQKVVLIDEPEISLHIDWQRSLLSKMVDQLGDRQIIVCTHSPSIGADYLDNMIELKSRSSRKSKLSH
jgi:predicted ATPase